MLDKNDQAALLTVDVDKRTDQRKFSLQDLVEKLKRKNFPCCILNEFLNETSLPSLSYNLPQKKIFPSAD